MICCAFVPCGTLKSFASSVTTWLTKLISAPAVTEAGQAYFARCRDIVEAARVAHEELHDLVERPRGLLRVFATPDFARLFLGDLASDDAARYPEVTLELDLSPAGST